MMNCCRKLDDFDPSLKPSYVCKFYWQFFFLLFDWWKISNTKYRVYVADATKSRP